MDCTEYRRLINELLDNEITERDEIDLFDHIKMCENCKIYMVNMNKLKLTIKSSFENNKKEVDLSHSIMSQISKSQPKKVLHIKKSYNILYKIASIVVILSLPLLFSSFSKKETKVSKDDTRDMVLEHLENSQNKNVTNIAYVIEK
ncbi:MAG: zf-HC2 domain-containing protein [Calditerrivibrio sp.]|nr:zf-HC2 domain-containing protein [Calditerrivibrio sp.]